MRIMLLLLVVVVISILWPSDLSFGACPEDLNDHGICDTLNIEVFPPDTLFIGPGQLVRVPIFVTHDVLQWQDSITEFVIPVYYTHTNPAKYCSISRYWNNTSFSAQYLPRSVFRDLVAGTDTIHNWFKDLYEQDPDGAYAWHPNLYFNRPDSFLLDFYCVLGPFFGEGSRALLATLTFRVEDTMTICLDSCRFPSGWRLALVTWDEVYIPRHNLPCSFSISCPKRGDFNADCIIDLGDMVFLTSYLYRGGPPPNPLWLGDTNCDGVVELGDRVKLGNYIYRGGSPPCSP